VRRSRKADCGIWESSKTQHHRLAIRQLIPGLAVTGLAIAAGVGLAAKPSAGTAAKYSTTLQGRSANQRHNAFLACSKLNGAVIPPRSEFSFNKRVGSWSRDAGYRRAPVSYNGTLIDAWGGGVCQTSTTLYNAALLAGLEVKERHPHRFAPSYVPPGRDAAVAFSGVDLRLFNPYDTALTIEAKFEGERLTVAFISSEPLPKWAIQTDVQKFLPPRELQVDSGGKRTRVMNKGKPGWSVVTYRSISGKREWVATDSYPSMDRVVAFN